MLNIATVINNTEYIINNADINQPYNAHHHL